MKFDLVERSEEFVASRAPKVAGAHGAGRRTVIRENSRLISGIVARWPVVNPVQLDRVRDARSQFTCARREEGKEGDEKRKGRLSNQNQMYFSSKNHSTVSNE